MTLNSFLRGTVIASVFGALLVPFIVFDNFFFPFIVGKGFFFRILIEVGFAAWLLLAFRDVSARPRKSPLLWAFVAFIAIMAIADLFGENPWKSFWSNFERMEGFITLAHLFMYFVIASSVLATEKIWKRFLECSVLSAFIMSVYSFFQLAGALVINQGGVRVDGKFGNATYLAIFLVFNIFFALILAYRSRAEKLSTAYAIGLYSGAGFLMVYVWGFLALSGAFTKNIPNLGSHVVWIYVVLLGVALVTWLSQKYSASIAYVYAVPVCGFVLYFTATRGAILGIMGGLLLTALIVAIFAKQQKTFRIVAGSVIGLLILLVGGFIAIRDSQFVAQSGVLGRFVSISWEENKTQARSYIWPMAVEGWKEKPLLGWGQENFNYIFNKNYDPRMYAQEQWFDHTHNIVLDWLVAGGLLGVLAYLSLFVAAILMLWRKSTSLDIIEKSLLTGLGAAYFFHNLFVFDNIVSYMLFVSVLAYIQFSATRFEKPIAEAAGEFDSSDTRTAGPLILIVLIFALYFFNWRGIATNVSLIDALRATSVNPVQTTSAIASFKDAFSYDTLGRGEVAERLVEAARTLNVQSVSLKDRQDFLALAKDSVEAQLKHAPGDARYEVFASNFYSQVGSPADALKHAQAAAELSPRKQTILFQLGSVYLSQKQYDKALDVLKKAFDLEPAFPDALKYYASALIYAGRESEADSLITSRGMDRAAFADVFITVYADKGDWAKVISLVQAKITADPSNLQNRMNLVAAYFQSGDKVRAVATLREMIAFDPTFKTTGEQYIQQIEASK